MNWGFYLINRQDLNLLFFVILGVMASRGTYAADFSTDVRSGANAPVLENGGFFELGVSLHYLDSSFELYHDIEGFSGNLNINGEYRYEKFFFEATQNSVDGLNLGYTLWAGKQWIVDILIASLFGRLDLDHDNRQALTTEEERNQAILDRDTFFNGAGFRATAYWYDYVYQLRWVKDTHGGNGIISDFKVGRNWQYRNWNFHGLLGIKWGSDQFAQYWFGVEENEATERFPAARIESGFYYIAEIGLTYPISENWVFSSFYRQGVNLSSLERESPLVSDDYDFLFVSSVSYVF